jgi:hypothetical protein
MLPASRSQAKHAARKEGCGPGPRRVSPITARIDTIAPLAICSHASTLSHPEGGGGRIRPQHFHLIDEGAGNQYKNPARIRILGKRFFRIIWNGDKM